MRIERIQCRNYKSIRTASLENCEALNILIGKNNAGKSNILKAIQAFFRFAGSSDFVTILTQKQVERDLFRQGETTADHASIVVSLALSHDEKAELVEDISREAPQVKNALSALDPDMRLRVEIVISPNPAMAYADAIELVSADGTHTELLLRVSRMAAKELREKASDITRIAREAQALERLKDNLDDFMSRSVRTDDPAYRIRMHMRRTAVSEEFRDEVMKLLEGAQDQSTIRQLLNDLAVEKHDEIESHRNAELSNEIDTFAGKERKLPEYITRTLGRISEWNVLYLDETRNPVGVEEARRLLSMKMRRGGPANLRAIQSTVSSLLGVQIDAFESAAKSRADDAQPIAEMDVDEFLVELNGSGIRESLRLILDVNFENPNALLLEEPEVHLHPALEYSVLQYLKDVSEQRQVFITTHSTNFLDTAGASNIYLVSKGDETNVLSVGLDELGDKIPQELGIRLSSVFMFDRLVFVEGPSDELILRELASKLDLNLAVCGVGFVQTSGARSFAHFANATMLEILSKRNVQAYFVLDRDERTDSDIDSMKKQCEDKAVCHIFRRREIENYLLNPEAIVALIQLKSNGQTQPSVEEVSNAIDTSIADLRDIAISRSFLHRTCVPLRFDRERLKGLSDDELVSAMAGEADSLTSALAELRDQLTQRLSDAKIEIDQRWASDAIAVVPGADVLDHVLAKYGFRYQKTKDGASLAKFIRREDIDREIEGILRQIATATKI